MEGVVAEQADREDEAAPRLGCRRIGAFLRAFLTGLVRTFGKLFSDLPYEYESPQKLLGWPLLSINLGFDNPGGRMRQARGVFAIGTQATGFVAFGIVVARGVFAVALLAVGAVAVSIASVALVSVSVAGLGVVSVSVFAVGYLAVGILALGWKSVGIVAIGQETVGILGLGRAVRAVFAP